MARLPGFVSRRVRSARVGDLPDPRPIEAGQTGRGIAGAGAGIAGIGLQGIADATEIQEKINITDTNREIANVSGFINAQVNGMQEFVAQNDDYTLYPKEWEGRLKAIQEAIANVSSSDARESLQNAFAKNKAGYQSYVTRSINLGKVERADADGRANMANIIGADYSVETEAINARRAVEAGKAGVEPLTQAEVKMQRIDDIIAANVSTNVWDRVTAGKFRAAAIEGITAVDDKHVANVLLGIGASAKHQEGPNAGLIDLDEGIDNINATDATPLQKQDAIKNLELQWADERRGRAVQIEKDENATRDAINKAQFAGDLTVMQNLIENGIEGVGILPETEQGVLLRAIRADLDAIEKGVAIETDWRSYEKVRRLVDPLANGDKTYDEVMAVYYEESKNLGRQERKELMEKLITAAETKAKAEPTNPEDQRIRKAISEFETNNLFVMSDDEVREMLDEEQYRTYENWDDEQQANFLENESVKKEVEMLNDYDQWLAEQKTPPTIEQKEAWLDDITKVPKTKQAKSFFRKVATSGFNLLFGQSQFEQGEFTGFGVEIPRGDEPQLGPIDTGRVTVVDKDGNKFTLPKNQLEEAEAQGFTLIK